jgi:UPF0755 protein
MAKLLKEEGVIDHERLFRVAVMIDPTPKPIKAGEYEIPAHISMLGLLDLLQSGKQVQRRLTVVEGMTTPEVIDLVKNTPVLSGEITLDLKEGDLLPETYFYSRDDTRDGLLMRMKEAMDKTLDEAWRKRAAGLPLANRREALTLASIVEKETAVPGERAKVAAVYINRLRRRMKLESDPTTIYGIVADGQGGHAFAGTLAEHNRNVERWRQIQRERAEQQQTQTPPGAPGAPSPAPPGQQRPAPRP